MISIIKRLKPFIYTLLITLIGLIPVSVLFYFNATSDKINNILIWIIGTLAISIGSYKFSYHSRYKGIINGLIFYSIFLCIMLLTSLVIFKSEFSMQNISYYMVILLFSTLFGIIGKNNKTDDN